MMVMPEPATHSMMAGRPLRPEPMSWKSPNSQTPGALAVRLRKARVEVERIVFHIAAAQRSGVFDADRVNEAYAELAAAAIDLVLAQGHWDEHVADRDAAAMPVVTISAGPCKSDFELVQ